MIDFRNHAPLAGAIQNLDFKIPQKLDIGGTVLYVCEPRPNEVLQLNLYWPSGLNKQSRRFQARSALSLSLNGTAQHSAEQIQEQFDFWGCQLHPDTGLKHSELVLRSTAEFFPDALNWLSQHFSEAVFPEYEIENHKQIEVASLMRKTTTPRYWSHRMAMESVFGVEDVNTRYSEPADILSLDPELIRDFHAKQLQLADAIWILSGDSSDSTIQAIEKIIKAGVRGIQNYNALVQNQAHEAKTIRYKVENTSQVSLFMVRPMEEIDQRTYHRYSMLNLILGGFFGSRLMQEIREEKGLTYGIGSYIQQAAEGNLWCISGEMNADNVDAALEAVHQILKALRETPPGAEELERAKRYFSGQLRTSFDGPFAMPGKLRGLMNRGYDFGHYTTAMEEIWSIKAEDLCEMADNYLRAEAFHTVLAGNIAS